MFACVFKWIKAFKKIGLLFFFFFYATGILNSEKPTTYRSPSDINKLSIFGDFIYWHASEETSSLWAYSPFLPTISAPNIYFNWSPGVKTGIDYTFCNNLDTKFYWTYFLTKAEACQSAENGGFIFPQFFNGFTTSSYYLTPYNSAELYWQIRINMFDFEIGHQFQWLRNFSMRPFFGIKGGTIKQKMLSTWKFSELDIANIIQISWKSTENVINNFLGAGPSFGIDNKWNIYKNLNFRGDFSGSFLWGRWKFQDLFTGKIKFEENWTHLDIYNSPTATNNSIYSNTLGSFMLRFFAGLDCTCEAKRSFAIKIGYEMQLWMNQLRIPTLQQVPVHGDLTLQGITCGILIKF